MSRRPAPWTCRAPHNTKTHTPDLLRAAQHQDPHPGPCRAPHNTKTHTLDLPRANVTKTRTLDLLRTDGSRQPVSLDLWISGFPDLRSAPLDSIDLGHERLVGDGRPHIAHARLALGAALTSSQGTVS